MLNNCSDGIVGNDGKTYYWSCDTNDFITTVDTHIPVNQVPVDVIVNYINKLNNVCANNHLVKPLSFKR